MAKKPTALIAEIEDNLDEATPVQIDTVLAYYYEAQGEIEAQEQALKVTLAKLLKTEKEIREGKTVVGYRTALHGLELLDNIAKIEARIEDKFQSRISLHQESGPYLLQFMDRQWPRYFRALTDGGNGHIHRTMYCHTCNREGIATRFAWLVEFSGKDEHELTNEVGETACTICYTWAETVRAEHEAKVRAERKAAKDAEKAEKARIAAQKGILTPEGQHVYTSEEHVSYNVAKTLRTAEIAATDALMDVILEEWRKGQDDWAFRFENRSYDKIQAEHTYHAWYLLRAIAHKKGQTFEETFQVHEKKAQAKFRKMQRDWAKDPRNR